MKKMYLLERGAHIGEWIHTLYFIFNNRGRNTYGANAIRGIVERHLLEYSSSLEDLSSAEKAFQEITKLLTLTKIRGLQRLGARNDGGYIGISLDGTPKLLSGGAGKNIDFELECASNGSEVHIYDPTIKKLPQSHDRITHFKTALSGSINNEFKNSVTLRQAMSALSTDSPKSIWLKLDIEGSEIDLLANDLELLPCFDQIFIEFHDTYKIVKAGYRNQFLKVLRKLNEHFHLISLTSNNWQGISNYGNSFMPVTFEATFLTKLASVKFIEEAEYKVFKSPNNSQRLEIPDFPFQISS